MTKKTEPKPKPTLTCPKCGHKGDDYIRIKKDDEGNNRKCRKCKHKWVVKRKEKSHVRKRKEDKRGLVIVEESYKRANDPEQMKLLTQIQTNLRMGGSGFSVSPDLKVVHEIRRLEDLERKTLAQAKLLREAIDMATGTKLYKRLAKDEKSEAVAAKDAFKFT